MIDDANDLDDDLGDQGDHDSPIDNDIGDLRSRNTDKGRLDMATQNRFMLDMLLQNQAQWIVLPTGPGNPPAVRVWTAKMGHFGSRPVQKPDPLTLCGSKPDP